MKISDEHGWKKLLRKNDENVKDKGKLKKE